MDVQPRPHVLRTLSRGVDGGVVLRGMPARRCWLLLGLDAERPRGRLLAPWRAHNLGPHPRKTLQRAVRGRH